VKRGIAALSIAVIVLVFVIQHVDDEAGGRE
jgi:hypothetical protein